MKIYYEKENSKKANVNNIPSVFAFNLLRNFLTSKEYEETRKEYFINNLTKSQVNQTMKDLKWLFREYEGLEVITMESLDGVKTRIVL
ncbi:hypothetical protein QSO81_06550 [Clostridioides difficile]|nr:hypothetical protein [Clostridioides difficile]